MTFRTEFPDFPATDMPSLPEGFEDHSWHNDVCPHFENAKGRISVWIDYADPAQREFSDAMRFTVSGITDEGYVGDVLDQSDSWDDVLSFLASVEGERT